MIAEKDTGMFTAGHSTGFRRAATRRSVGIIGEH